jgi:Calx-beta domain/Metallo-peptidase family M12/Divergent InlB B-repeat domain
MPLSLFKVIATTSLLTITASFAATSFTAFAAHAAATPAVSLFESRKSAVFTAEPTLANGNGSFVEKGLLRKREVVIEGSALAKIAALAKSQTSATPKSAADGKPQLTLAFFDDTEWIVQIDRADTAIVTGERWSTFTGSVAGVAFSSATIVEKDGVIAGTIRARHQQFQIHHKSGALHEVREIDASVFRDHDPTQFKAIVDSARKDSAAKEAAGKETVGKENAASAKTFAPPVSSKKTSASTSKASPVQADDGSMIDVMVVYTPQAQSKVGGAAGMQSKIALAVTETNDAYASSNVVQRIRVVYSGVVSYNDTGNMGTDLSALRDTSDNKMDEIHAIRNAYGADLVSLWVADGGGSCGLGSLMSTESAAFASSGFNVVDVDCATGNYSFGHELGHNMGLRHDPHVDTSTTSVTPAGGGALTVINYAHGYVDLVNRFRTVMSYNDQCRAQTPAFDCTRIKYFSNPDAQYLGNAAGNATTGNNARALNDTRETTSNFRQTVTAPPTGGFIVIQPSSYTVSEGAGSVTITVQRTGGSTGAASVNYSTQNGTATAGADYTAVSGTLSWANGDAVDKTIVVPILQDTITEATETFTVALSAATGALIATASATVNIKDDEPGIFPPGCTLPTTGWSIPAGANAGWQVATDFASEGQCSLKSAPIGDNQKAQFQFSGNFVAGSITFDRRVSSEVGFDCLRVVIDGTRQTVGTGSNCNGTGVTDPTLGASGEAAWGAASIPITAGAHTIMWSYEKDENTIGGGDAAWIDKLVLPLAIAGPVTLSVAKVGGGSGLVTSTPSGIACGSTCAASFTSGTVVTLTATADTGSSFTSWSGCTSVTANICSVTLNSATSVIATFTPTTPASLSKRGGIDLDGAGKSALIVRSTSNNQLSAGRLVANTFEWTTMTDPGADYRLLGAIDLVGNGKSDLAMLNVGSLNANGQGEARFWNDFSNTTNNFLRLVKPEWDVQAIADMDGDGVMDLVWRFRGMSPQVDDQGVSFIWFSRNTPDAANNNSYVGQVRKRGGAPLTWKVLGAVDLNGDGAADLIYIAPPAADGTQTMRVLMATPPRTCANLLAGSIPAGFTAIKLADFTGNRRGDVLARDNATGAVRILSLSGAGVTLPPYTLDPDNILSPCTPTSLSLTQTTAGNFSSDASWVVFATGDFNGDGIFDIVFRRPDNSLVVWLMQAGGANPVVINAGSVPAGFVALPLQ